MAFLAKRCSILSLLVIVFLIGSDKARAESPADARKRAFAEVLARPAKTAHAESSREIANAARLKSRTDRTKDSGRSTEALPRIAHSRSRHFGRVKPTAASATGVSAATPVAPSGIGVHKDTFVESLFESILLREPTEGELYYWSKALKEGLAPEIVVKRLFKSSEHQTLIRNGTASGISWENAYRQAYEAAHPGEAIPWLR